MTPEHGDIDVRVHESADEAAQAAAELLAELARSGGRLALSGGSTPGPAYLHAAHLEADWSRSELFWADERCVPPDDSRSNFRLARESLISVVDRPPVVHRIRGEAEPETAAAEYDELLAGITLDLVLLGIGDDGHTASLFPNSPVLRETARRAVTVDRPDVVRVTMTPPVLERAGTVLFLVTGAGKADAVRRAFAEPPNEATPASEIRSASGRTIALLDRAAASRLPV